MTSFRHSAAGRTRTAARCDASLAATAPSSLRRAPVERTATALRERPGFRCATLRMAFGLSLFAATGAGAGAAGSAHAATHTAAAQGAVVEHVASVDR